MKMLTFLLLLATLSLSIPPASSAGSGILHPGEYVTEGGWGNLSMVNGKDGVLVFEISAVGANAHTCSLTNLKLCRQRGK